MKKLIVTLLMGAMVITAAACVRKAKPEDVNSNIQTDDEIDGEITGGWVTESDKKSAQELQVMLDQATEGLEGAVYEPVKILAAQIVAGTNYAVLCKVTPVVPDAESSYCIVYVYEDLEGNAVFTRVQDFVKTENDEVEGGWSTTVDEETAKAAVSALEKASEEIAGAGYEAEAVIAAQTAAGTNYRILCKVTTVTPEETVTYDLVTVCVDLEGNAEITDVNELEYSMVEPAAALDENH